MIAVIDYGMGNLRSVQKALEHVGGEARIVSDPAEVDAAEKVILPGVGAFGDAIARLRETQLDAAALRAIDQGRPLLGICLGYQLLFESSTEHGEHTGLGVLPGRVVHFDLPAGGAWKVPHIGWNRLAVTPDCPLMRDLPAEPWVYFVHSYHPVDVPEETIAARTDYGYTFASAVWKGNCFATQFHPEKSQTVGLQMLRNFVSL